MEKQRELFVFWQFNGNNSAWCNQTCPYCYGGAKEMKHYWNGDVEKWEKAFERLRRDIYFVMSYGEALGSHGFYDCVNMIGEHPTWKLCVITNLSYDPTRLINTRLAREKRLFVNPCWHPLGVKNRLRGKTKFRKHCLMLKNAGVPIHVLMVWYPPQIKWFPEHFAWFDKHNIRVGIRRFIVPKTGLTRFFGGRYKLADYTGAERNLLYAATCPKVTEYGLNLASSKGKLCLAGKDMILVKYDGMVTPCADCEDVRFEFGNIFNPDFKLNAKLMKCPVTVCGGDYGMLHMVDDRFGKLMPLWNDTFYSQVEGIRDKVAPVPYPRRDEILEWMDKIKRRR